MARATVLRVERWRVVSAADMVADEGTLRVEDSELEWRRELTLWGESGVLVSAIVAGLAAWALLEGLEVEISDLTTVGDADEQTVKLTGKPRPS